VNPPAALGISGFPNDRISREVAALAALRHDSAPSSVAELREFLDAEQRPSVEPEDIWQLAETLGYTAEIRPSATATDGTFNVLFRRKNAIGMVRFPTETQAARPSETYATNPLRSRLLRDLVPGLRDRKSVV